MEQTLICPNFPGCQTLPIENVENNIENRLSEEEEQQILNKVIILARQKKNRQLKTIQEINPGFETTPRKTGRPRAQNDNPHPLIAKRREYRRNLYERKKNGDIIKPKTIPSSQ